MAEVAHDASGPASPKPSDVAPEQASRPDSPDKGKLRVFISYSRNDADFADQLEAALDAYGFETSIDRHGVSGGEEWQRRLGNLISEADTVVFVLTPTSARSPICSWEVEEAARLGKRILPANWRPLEGVSPPPQLRERNYVFFYDNPKEPGSGFGTGLAKLVAALNTDFDWLREHTRYLQRATEWDRGGRPANRLLSGDDIAEAKAWVARRPKNAPEPTALHLDFIRASEEEAEARSSAQRKQLEAMAAAQAERATALQKAEEALKQAADAQRKRSRIRNIAFVVVSILAVLAGWFYWQFVEEQRATAEMMEQRTADSLERATDVFAKEMDQMDVETKEKVFAVLQWNADRGYATAMFGLGSLYHHGQDYAKAYEWYEKAASKGHATAMTQLGLLYENGLGVAQDYAKAREWYEKAAGKSDARAKPQLEELPIKEAAGAGHYAQALQLQEALAAKQEAAETKRNPGEETARAFKGVAWYALFAREFTKALTASDRAHAALLANDLGIEANRAHALMFLGHGNESKALYLAHKGKPVSWRDRKLWERAIVEDFAQFRKAGLTHPMMAEIEKELGVSP
jgi:TPR repeat protein